MGATDTPLPDLIELSGYASGTLYETDGAGPNLILGLVDNATYTDTDPDNSATNIVDLNTSTSGFGGSLTISGVQYDITELHKPGLGGPADVTITMADTSTITASQGDIVYMKAVSQVDGAERWFAVPDDSLGDFGDVASIDTGSSNSPDSVSINADQDNNVTVCYASGTLIDTPEGPRTVEALRPGDPVMTLDHGPMPIRWVRSADQPLDASETEAKPVLIAAGALGSRRPTHDLVVSPQHRVLVGGGGQLEGWFTSEAFVPAKALTMLRGIRPMNGKKSITWIHFACDRHEVVKANGCLSEALLLGPMVLNGLSRAERKELRRIYGAPAAPDTALNGPAARKCLKVAAVRQHLAKCKTKVARRGVKDTGNWNCDVVITGLDLANPPLKRQDRAGSADLHLS